MTEKPSVKNICAFLRLKRKSVSHFSIIMHYICHICDCRGKLCCTNSNLLLPRTVDPVPSSPAVPLPGGLGAAVLLLVPESRSPLLPGGRHRRAFQQRAGQPAAAHLRRPGEEPHRDGAQAGVYRGHALPPPHLRRPPGQGMERGRERRLTWREWVFLTYNYACSSLNVE